MKKLIFAVILMTITWSAFAQETIFRKNAKGVLESVEFSAEDKEATIPASAEIFFKDMLKAKPTDEFRKVQRRQKQKEFVREHFEQYCNGVKIEGAGYNFHYKNGKMYFAHGHYVDVSSVNTKPSITGHEAMTRFAKYKNIPEKGIKDYMAELIIKEIPEKTDTLPALVYRVFLYAGYPQNREIGFIDAHTGSLRMTEPAFIDFSAQGTFATRYSGSQQGITHHYQGGYHLVDSTRNAVIHTWNLEGRTDINLPLGTTTAVELTDLDNVWTQAEHRFNNNDMGLDVQWALQGIYDRLYNTHNINSMDDDADNDGNGFMINAFIRDGLDPDNAFWNPNRETLSFGQGGVDFRSLASVDVVAHEFGHGITHFQVGWNNSIDQRAFNEGMSDIWAVIMEHRVRPNSVWQIGEQLTLNHACLRNIQNPNASNAMSQIANTYASPQYNSGDSYVRGGVFSHWFYLLVNGGTGVNALGRSYSVQGIGMDMAENLIVKAVYDGYLRFTTSYAQIRTSMINAAREIAGTNSFLEHQVENAWYAVGVGDTQYQYTITGPSTVCNQATFTINNLPQGATVNWTLMGSLSMVQNNGSSIVVAATGSSTNSRVYATISVGSNQINLMKGVTTGINISISGPNVVNCNNTGTWTSSIAGCPPVEDITYKWTFENQTNGQFFNMYGQTASIRPSCTNMIMYKSNGSQVDEAIRIPPGLPSNTYNITLKATTESDVSYYAYKNNVVVNGYMNWLLPDAAGSDNLIHIYPNPANGIVTIALTEGVNKTSSQTTGKSASYTIQLWNSFGLVKSTETDLTEYQLSLHGIPAGFYYVNVIKDGHVYRKQLTVK
jgi:Zn-dependent metalloprotease